MTKNNIALLDQSQIQAASTEELRSQLAQSLTVTAQSLAYLSSIWKELTQRGEDLSSLRGGLATYLPQIANGELAAEAVVRYAGQRMLLRALSGMPLAAQRELVESGEVQHVAIDREGSPVTSTIPLHNLSSTDVAIVFDDGRVRTTEEQYHLLVGKGERVGTKEKKRFARQVRLSDGGDGILVGGKLGKIDRIIEALSELYGVDVEAAIREAKNPISE